MDIISVLFPQNTPVGARCSINFHLGDVCNFLEAVDPNEMKNTKYYLAHTNLRNV
jgi:hypothetical protein